VGMAKHLSPLFMLLLRALQAHLFRIWRVLGSIPRSAA
jgi:hypothetical protein